MLYLILCILCTTSLVFMFKLFERFKVPTFQGIVVNYIFCFVIGLLLPENKLSWSSSIFSETWVYMAMLLGCIFIGTFYLIALTTQRVGITAASVATKISLVIPVLFSLLVLQNNLKNYTWLNYLGMLLAVFAIILASARQTPEKSATNLTPFAILLPFIVFVNCGVADTLVNITNHYFLAPEQAGLFTMFTFTTSAAIGSLVLIYRRLAHQERFNIRSLPAGILLGLPNYFSIYFLLNALTAFNNDGAFLFPVNNIGIILAGALGAVLLFGERLSRRNVAGIALAVLALLLLSYQEIIGYLS